MDPRFDQPELVKEYGAGYGAIDFVPIPLSF
jgi:hypothetical protein